MKIVFIYPFLVDPYGGERHLAKLTSTLAEMGHKVYVVTLRTAKPVNDMMSKKVVIKSLDLKLSKNLFRRTFKSTTEAKALAKRAARIKAKFYCGMGWQTTIALNSLSKDFGIKKSKLIYYCLEPPRFLHDLKKEQNSLVRFVSPLLRNRDYKNVRNLKNIIANSQWTKDQIRNIYNLDVPVIVPGIEKKRFDKYDKEKLRKELDFPERTKVYITTSKLHKRKGIDKAISYFSRNAKGLEHFYIIGDGPEKAKLKKLAKHSRLANNIHFLGRLKDRQVEKYIKASDIFIFTAKNEPYGIAPREAVYAGLEVKPNKVLGPILSWEGSTKKFVKYLESL
ncbi:MAG: glycosyltransferase family 4 protein [bacterium]